MPQLFPVGLVRFMLKQTWMFVLALIMLCSQSAQATRDLGIYWDAPGFTAEDYAYLETLHQLGFGWIVLEEAVPAEVLEWLTMRNYSVIVQIPNVFTTSHEVWRNGDEIKRRSLEMVMRYASVDAVVAMSVFKHAQYHNAFFKQTATEFVQQFSAYTDKPLLFTSTVTHPLPTVAPFRGVFLCVKDAQELSQWASSASALLYTPQATEPYHRKAFQALLQQSREVPLFFYRSWLMETSQVDAELLQIASAYYHDPNALFSNPPPLKEAFQIDYIVILLFLVLLVFGFHYGFEPNYRKSLIRYYLNHGFFVSDIAERRIRFNRSSMLVFVQHALVGGIVCYALGLHLFSSLGYQAFTHHFNLVTFYTDERLGMFFAGISLVVVFQLINLAWLHSSQKEFAFFSQTATIYLWPGHLNILLLILLLTNLLADGTELITYFCAISLLLMPHISFYLAARDVANKMVGKLDYFFRTSIPHFLLLISLCIWLELTYGVLDVLFLAELLP